MQAQPFVPTAVYERFHFSFDHRLGRRGLISARRVSQLVATIAVISEGPRPVAIGSFSATSDHTALLDFSLITSLREKILVPLLLRDSLISYTTCAVVSTPTSQRFKADTFLNMRLAATVRACRDINDPRTASSPPATPSPTRWSP